MNSSKCKISVLMSVYKENISWIETAINSILTQSFKDFEFIIVDDNPADVNLTNFLKDKQRQDNRMRQP